MHKPVYFILGGIVILGGVLILQKTQTIQGLKKELAFVHEHMSAKIAILQEAHDNRESRAKNAEKFIQMTQEENRRLFGEIVYTDPTYKFSFRLPPTRKGYTTKKNDTYIYFGFQEEIIFAVAIMSHAQREQTKGEEGPIPQYMGENEQYVFGYNPAQEISEKLFLRYLEVDDIIKTFTTI